MPNVQVPGVVGLGRDAAVAAIAQSGLAAGQITKVISDASVNTVTRTIPATGTDLPPGSKVDVDISIGLWRQRWWEDTSSLIFSSLGILTLLTVLVVLGVSFVKDNPLEELGNLEKARGLITFLIAFTTIGIAVILTISTVVLQDSPENDKRFDRGKQVLTVLIGVLGTIVGFYFAGGQVAPSMSITSTTLPDGIVGAKYTETRLVETGGTAPFTWKADGLPKGLALGENNGVLSGTPSEAVESKSLTFTVEDANSKTASKQLKISIKPAQDATPVTKGP